MTNDSQPPRFSDASLLVRFQAGEDDAATALYTRYAERLMELASHINRSFMLGSMVMKSARSRNGFRYRDEVSKGFCNPSENDYKKS